MSGLDLSWGKKVQAYCPCAAKAEFDSLSNFVIRWNKARLDNLPVHEHARGTRNPRTSSIREILLDIVFILIFIETTVEILHIQAKEYGKGN